MTIRYHWEDMPVNVAYNGQPKTHVEIRDVDFDLWVNVQVSDIVGYLIPYHLGKHIKNKTEEDIKECGYANHYMSKALQYLLDQGALDLEQLESDTYFMLYMREEYEQKALEEWEEQNELERYWYDNN